MLRSGHHRRRLFRFAVLGCTNALIGYGVFIVLFQSGLFPSRANGALSQGGSYSVGIVWAFFWSRYWAFRDGWSDGASLSSQAFRFVAAQAWSFVFSVLLVSVIIDGIGWQPLPGWICAMSVVTVVHYLIISSWVFPLRSNSHQATFPNHERN